MLNYKKLPILIILLIIILLILILFITYVKKSKTKLESYNDILSSLNTSYGKISYIDKGSGDTILVAHGLFGGYDQGYEGFKNLDSEYRILAPSRFGYPGSDLPTNATVKDQAKAYLELIDSLNIDKVYVLGTSAGGSVAIRFALEYPERVKGLILYCSNAIDSEKPAIDKIPGYAAVPKFFCNDFVMWLSTPIMKNVMNMSDETWATIFPVDQRKNGIVNDGYNANRDMLVNYDDYTIEKMKTPVLALHAKDDKLADYTKVENMIKRFPNGTLVSFETGGHMMQGHEKETETALKQFLNKNK